MIKLSESILLMQIKSTIIPDVMIVTPKRIEDSRGFFSESWNYSLLAENGIKTNFVQDNHSLSHEPFTVRGLHFQSPPNAQAKLVRCGRGRLLDVAVDIRKGSPYYGHWVSEELSFENGKQLFIPVGFLHGFVTLEPHTEIIYKCSNYYALASDGAIFFNDPEIGIDWQVDVNRAILSEKDASAKSFSSFNSPFTYSE